MQYTWNNKGMEVGLTTLTDFGPNQFADILSTAFSDT